MKAIPYLGKGLKALACLIYHPYCLRTYSTVKRPGHLGAPKLAGNTLLNGMHVTPLMSRFREEQ